MAFLGVDMQWHNEGDFYGVDGEYHPAGQIYAPARNADGEMVKYRPASSPYKIEGGTPSYGSPGSFLGVDGKRYPANYFYGVDGRYHQPDAYYDFVRSKYSDVKD